MAEDLEALVRRGRAHRVAGDIDAAITVFDAAVQAFPEAARPLCERGAALLLQQRFGEALADYQEAERLEPDYRGLHSYLAEVHLYLGAPDEALAHTGRGLRAEPDDLMHRINLAHALLFLGRREAALAEYATLRAEAHPAKRLTGADIVLDDVRLLRAANVVCEGLDEVERLMGRSV